MNKLDIRIIGKYCSYRCYHFIFNGYRKKKPVFVCDLFNEELKEDKKGKFLRCKECLKRFDMEAYK